MTHVPAGISKETPPKHTLLHSCPVLPRVSTVICVAPLRTGEKAGEGYSFEPMQ